MVRDQRLFPIAQGDNHKTLLWDPVRLNFVEEA